MTRRVLSHSPLGEFAKRESGGQSPPGKSRRVWGATRKLTGGLKAGTPHQEIPCGLRGGAPQEIHGGSGGRSPPGSSRNLQAPCSFAPSDSRPTSACCCSISSMGLRGLEWRSWLGHHTPALPKANVRLERWYVLATCTSVRIGWECHYSL